MSVDDSQRAAWVKEAVDRFSGPLVRYVQVITGDVEQARDVVQDAFIRLCAENPERVNSHLAQWLFTVCRHRAVDLQRKQRKSKTLPQTQMEAVVCSEPSPAMQAEQREASDEALRLLALLPKNQQEVVRLKFQNGLSYREISEVTHLSVSNVGFLLHTALKTLRQQMKSALTRKMP